MIFLSQEGIKKPEKYETRWLMCC